MLRLVSTVIDLPVISQRDRQGLGRLAEPAFDTTTGKLVAYRASNGSFLSTTEVLAYVDDALIVQDDSALQPEEDLVRLVRLGQRRSPLLGLRAVSESQRKLGKVTDVLIETDSHLITRVHIKPGGLRGLAASELIVPRERIARMDSQQVVVRYDNGVHAASAAVRPGRRPGGEPEVI